MRTFRTRRNIKQCWLNVLQHCMFKEVYWRPISTSGIWTITLNNQGPCTYGFWHGEAKSFVGDNGVRALPKVLEAYMGEATLPTNPTRSILDNLFRIVIELFWQHDNQLKSGPSLMEIHINHWLPTKGRVPNTYVEGLADQGMSLEVRNIES